MNKILIKNLKSAKRTIKIIFSSTILFLGIALLVLPGPGIPIIILALVILAAEYIWARKLLEKVKLNLIKLRKSDWNVY